MKVGRAIPKGGQLAKVERFYNNTIRLKNIGNVMDGQKL
jgi:hypothetical protein